MFQEVYCFQQLYYLFLLHITIVMEAFEVFPVLIKNIPNTMTVDQLYNMIFCPTNWANYDKHSANLVFHSVEINNKHEWLMVFKNMTSQLDTVHHMNQADAVRRANRHDLMALVPYQPYLNVKVTKSNLRAMKMVENHRYKADNVWKSYSFINCLAVNISQMMKQSWTLVPVHCDRWHLIVLDQAAFINPIANDDPMSWFPLAIQSRRDFAGFILNRNNSANVKLRNRYQKDSVGLLYNKNWKSHHIFELTDHFVDKRNLLNHKKAIFNLCLSETAVDKHSKSIQTILNIKPDRHFYAINVRIPMDRNLKPSRSRRNPPIIRKRKRVQIDNISRLIDVRFWSVNEIKDFLMMSAEGKYFDIFMAHNLSGKRLEFLTVELLTYCSVPRDDAQRIITCKTFFIDCQQIVQEYEMNKGGHLKEGNKTEIKSKIDALNMILTECVSKKYLCDNKHCASFLRKYERLYEYMNHYVQQLQNKMMSHEGRNQLIENVKQKVNIVMENEDAFIRDYALFNHAKPIRDRGQGCILIKIENIKFCNWFYGNVCATSIIKLMEKKLMSLCNDNAMYHNYEYKIRIYHNNTNARGSQYVILCSQNMRLNQFKSFCLLLGRITYTIPKFWEPICSSMNINEYNKCMKLRPPDRMKNNGFYERSPSQEIEGRPRKKKPRKHTLLTRSLSKIIKMKSTKNVCEDRRVFLSHGYNDDAASISHERDENVNNENCDLSNKCVQKNRNAYLMKCKELKSVFVTVCGVFSDNATNIEYYEECEKVQTKLNDKLLPISGDGTRPLQWLEGFDMNDICVVKKV
eukprot:42670_1